jgi:hypothetical protein
VDKCAPEIGEAMTKPNFPIRNTEYVTFSQTNNVDGNHNCPELF